MLSGAGLDRPVDQNWAGRCQPLYPERRAAYRLHPPQSGRFALLKGSRKGVRGKRFAQA